MNAEKRTDDYVRQDVNETLANLEVDAARGLSDAEVRNRLTRYGYNDILKLLLDKGAKVDLQASDGVTALILKNMLEEFPSVSVISSVYVPNGGGVL